MDQEQALCMAREELEQCFNDWDGDFKVTLIHEEELEGFHYLSATIKYKWYELEFDIQLRTTPKGVIEIDMMEDSWTALNKAELFVLMWFYAMDAI